MLSLNLPKHLESKLSNLAAETKWTKSFYLKEALREYLEEYEDAYLALERLNDKNAKYLTSGEMKKRLEI